MQELIRFQTDRSLDKNEYVPINEAANIVEELLEAIGLDVPKANRPQLKEMFATFAGEAISNGVATVNTDAITPEDRVDAYTDIIVFCTGALLKLGYNPEIAIAECGKEINSRVGSMVDGKFEKDLSPEAQANWYKADYSVAKR